MGDPANQILENLKQMNARMDSVKRKMEFESKLSKPTTNFESRLSVPPNAHPKNHASDSTAIMTAKSLETPGEHG
jgi:hypothetical protein